MARIQTVLGERINLMIATQKIETPRPRPSKDQQFISKVYSHLGPNWKQLVEQPRPPKKVQQQAQQATKQAAPSETTATATATNTTTTA
jgi:hypothetical protein